MKLGLCFYELHLFNEAIYEFDLAYKYNDKCLESIKKKALSYTQIKDYASALNEFLFLYKIIP